MTYMIYMGFPGGSEVKAFASNAQMTNIFMVTYIFLRDSIYDYHKARILPRIFSMLSSAL